MSTLRCISILESVPVRVQCNLPPVLSFIYSMIFKLPHSTRIRASTLRGQQGILELGLPEVSSQNSGRSTHALEHDPAQSRVDRDGHTPAQPCRASLSHSCCCGKYLKIVVFYQPAQASFRTNLNQL